MILWDAVLEKLGIKYGDKFEWRTSIYKIDEEDGLMFKSTDKFIKSTSESVDSFLLSIPSDIKIKFSPNNGERYYYVDPSGEVEAALFNQDVYVFDMANKLLGNCFRTREQAVANKDKILEKFKGIKEGRYEIC